MSSGSSLLLTLLTYMYNLHLECLLKSTGTWHVEWGPWRCAIKGDCRILPLLSLLHPGYTVNGPCSLTYSIHPRPQTEVYAVRNWHLWTVRPNKSFFLLRQFLSGRCDSYANLISAVGLEDDFLMKTFLLATWFCLKSMSFKNMYWMQSSSGILVYVCISSSSGTAA